jgi:hypothetical protein
VEALRKINETLQAKGGGALTGQKLKKAAMERVFGFELLPAPFVVSHLQLGLLLKKLGAPLAGKRDERVGVYLTNALTGWEPPKEPKTRLLFPELEEERDAADRVKRDVPILVILGNPPYNAFAGTSPEEEAGLVEPYKEGLNSPVAEGGWGIRKFNLDDLYVRFFRIAERRIVGSGKGIVSYISNFSYLGDPSFVVMRQRFLEEFDKLWFDCMNGDSRETGKLTPEGKPDPSVFSTETNREGIRVGTAICVMARKQTRAKKPAVLFRHFWGTTKRDDLVRSLKTRSFDKQYERAAPAREGRYSFRPAETSTAYLTWPRVTDLCAVPPMNGLMEKRGGALIAIDRDDLERRMRAYFDPQLNWEQYQALQYGLTHPQAGFDPKSTRSKVLSQERYDPTRVVHYATRPFEARWCYYTQVASVWNRARPSLWAQQWAGNSFFATRPTGVAAPEGIPCSYTSLLGDNDALRGHAYYFPLRIENGKRLKKRQEGLLFAILEDHVEEQEIVANLSRPARDYLAALKIGSPDKDERTAALLWMHALAISYSPAYLSENADGIRQDWPRIPLPKTRALLFRSAELGAQVAALLDTEHPVPRVTTGTIRPELKPIGVISRVGGGSLDPGAGHLDVTAGWGHAGKGGVTMPAKGRLIERPYTDAERDALKGTGPFSEQNPSRRPAGKGTCPLVGETTYDIYLNDVAYWRCIPQRVWDYTIGGYQVIKKWLSYREKELLNRPLKLEEAEYITEVARRLAALILLEPALDANYHSIRQATAPWAPM